jgi:hypothetical protein
MTIGTFVNDHHLAMMVDVMVQSVICRPVTLVLLTIRHQGSKRPNHVVGPVHRRKHASGSYCRSAGTGHRTVTVQQYSLPAFTYSLAKSIINANTSVTC